MATRPDKTLEKVKESVGKIILVLADAVYALGTDIVPEWDKDRIRVIEKLGEVIKILKEI